MKKKDLVLGLSIVVMALFIWFGGQKKAQAKEGVVPSKWQYQVKTIHLEHLSKNPQFKLRMIKLKDDLYAVENSIIQDELDKWGKQGWELVQVQVKNRGVYSFYLKKKQ